MKALGLHRLSLDMALTFGRQFFAGLLQLGIILFISRLLGPEGAGVRRRGLGAGHWHIGGEFDPEPVAYPRLRHRRRGACNDHRLFLQSIDPTDPSKPDIRYHLVASADPHAVDFQRIKSILKRKSIA